MKTKSLVSRLEKVGATVTVDGNSYTATSDKTTAVVAWFDQDGSAICVHTPSKHTDVQTDCFCDTWHHTIKNAVRVLE